MWPRVFMTHVNIGLNKETVSSFLPRRHGDTSNAGSQCLRWAGTVNTGKGMCMYIASNDCGRMADTATIGQ